MTSLSKNVYINKLTVNEYNTTHSIVKMKPADVKSSIDFDFIDFDKENNDKDSTFKVVDHVRISKQKHFLKSLGSKLVRKIFCD